MGKINRVGYEEIFFLVYEEISKLKLENEKFSNDSKNELIIRLLEKSLK